MKEYSFLTHMCDIRMKVEADSLVDLFSAALEGMNSIITGGREPVEDERQQLLVDIESVDITALLIDFLSEVLSETHTAYVAFDELEVLQLADSHLRAVLHGNKVEGFAEDIKAVTYHEAEVRMNGEGYYQSVIVFDI